MEEQQPTGMESLGDVLEKLTPPMQKKPADWDRHPVPEGPLCTNWGCGKLLPDAPGLREALEVRGWGSQYLACHCARDEEEHQRLRWANANLPIAPNGEPRTFESFRQSKATEAAFRAAVKLADCLAPPFLTLVGDTGSGKTHLLEAIGRHTLDKGWNVRYDYVPELLLRLRPSRSQEYSEENPGESEQTLMNYYMRVPVLLLDDLGVEKTSAWTLQELTTIIDHRMRMGGWTAIATNKLYQAMVDSGAHRIASRLWDAYTGAAKVVALTGDDYRLMGPPKK